MTAPLNSPAPSHPLILEKGADLLLVVKYKPLVVDGNGAPVLDADGNPQFVLADYPAGASAQLVIDTDPPLVEVAVIDGDTATVHVDYTVTDSIGSGMVYRFKIVHADGYDQVIVKGKTKRQDS